MIRQLTAVSLLDRGLRALRMCQWPAPLQSEGAAAQVAQSPASEPPSTATGEGASGVAAQKHTVFSTTTISDPEHGSGSSGHEPPPPSELKQPNTRGATAKARRMAPKTAEH